MAGRQPTVLLVEDDTGTTEFLSELLEPAGYVIEQAHDGVDALERIAEGGIDLVLLDLMLPDLDGLEVCRRVRSQERDDHLPIIMLTALGSDNQRHAGFTAGADDYLTKPFNVQELLDRASVWTRVCRHAPSLAQAPAASAPATMLPLAAQVIEPVAPADWCHQMLTAVREQPTQGPDIAALEMLLTACIELDPTPEQFAGLLAGHVAAERPGIAEAARVLQRAWRREQTGGDPPTAPSFQETLRTLGGLLDQSGAAVARVAVTPDGAEVQAYQEAQQRHLDRQDLAHEIGQWRARRGRAPHTDPTSPSRYETLLRAVGLMLDSDPAGAYDLVVTPRQVVVDSPAGGSQIFTVEQLTALLRASVQGRDAPAPADF